MPTYSRNIRPSPHTQKMTHMAEWAPWRALVAPGVVQNRDRSLLRVYETRGPDLATTTPEHAGATMWRMNDSLKRLTGDWAIFTEAQRRRVTQYSQVACPHPVPQLLDAYHGQALLSQAYHTKYFLTLRWSPPSLAT